MTCEISVMHSMEATRIAGTFHEFINDLNNAAARNKQFVVCDELLPDGSTGNVAFDTRNITRIREIAESSAFVGI